MTLERQRIRFRLDVTKVGYEPLVEEFNAVSAIFPRSRDAQIEIVLLNAGQLDQDVANISSITCEVKTYQSPSSSPLISVTIAAVDITPNPDAGAVAARTAQHAIINFTAGQTGLNMGGADVLTKTFDIVFTAVRNGQSVTLGKGSVTWLNDGGVYSGNTPTPGDPTYYTKDEINAILSSKLQALRQPGQFDIYVSPSGHYRMTKGIDDAGNEISDKQYVP